MAYSLQGNFHEELISKCLAQFPKELLKLIGSYLMIGWKEVIMATYMLRGHVKCLKDKLRGPHANVVLLALQDYLQICCIKTEYDKKHKDEMEKLDKSIKCGNRFKDVSLYHLSDIFKQYTNIRGRADDVKHKLIVVIYEGYVYVDGVLRLRSELTEAEICAEGRSGLEYPTYLEYWDR